MKIRSNYRVQPGCHSCRKAFVMDDWDSPAEWFCTLGAPRRPPCGSVGMKESFRDARPYGSILNVPEADRRTDRDPFFIAIAAWEEWSKGRQIEAYGICDDFEPKD